MVYKRTVCSCLCCKAELSTTQLDRHFKSKQCLSGGKFVSRKYKDCPYCELNMDNINSPNHMKWCKNNPDRGKGTIGNINAGKQMQTQEAVSNRINGIKKAHADGRYDTMYASRIGKPGHKPTEETKKLQREKALASPHRRLRKSVREYVKKDGTIVKLDSSWEEALAVQLDNLGVEWERPSPIKWEDADGIYHNYFPDFYLPYHDIYLDPKNPHAVNIQKSKLICLTTQIKNLIIITSLEDCKNFNP